MALGLIACGLAGALVLSPAFASLVVAYLILTLAYSYRLKSVPIVDVFVLGILFTLRILMGTALIGQPVAPWLLAFSLFFFISLSMAKRQSELVSAKNRGHAGPIAGRGYNTADIPLTLIIGVCSSFAAVLLLFLYVVNDAYPVEAYSQPQWLWIIGFIIFLWSMRVWLLSHRGQLNEDPVLFAIRDRESWMMGFAMVVCFALAVS